MSELLDNIARFEQATADLKATISEAHTAAKDLRAAMRDAAAADAAQRAAVLEVARTRAQPAIDAMIQEAGTKVQDVTRQAQNAVVRRFNRLCETLWLDTQGNDVRDDIRHWTRVVSSWTANQPPPDRLGLPDIRKKGGT